MIYADEFIEELSAFIESYIIADNFNPKNGLLNDFRDQLRTQMRTLLDKYQPKHTRKNAPLFTIGDDNQKDAEVQVDLSTPFFPHQSEASTANNCASILKVEEEQLLADMHRGRFKHRMLEQRCHPSRAVYLRRLYMEKFHKINLKTLPFQNYDYSEVKDACCENVIGYLPVPTGIAGPLCFDENELVPIPLSTTEGALVASVSRGCLCINESITLLGSDAFYVEVFKDGITRAPVLEFERVREASACYKWVQKMETFAQLKRVFEETSRFANLLRIDPHLIGNNLFLRFAASTGDAMGMNMITKGTGRVLEVIKREFPKARLISISGNLCVDKKASAINWIEGRGKSVVAELVVPTQVVERVLKTSVDKMVEIGNAKLMVGSSAAVTIGGWNAHAANVVAAMFLATGQDVAQVVSSSMCMTQLIKRPSDNALHIKCTMNCLEVGTIGGGTVLSPQSACLEMLGCRRPNLPPGQNAERFARLVCATVMAGELSLLASQCNEGDLERSHLRMNRSSRNLMLSGSASQLMINSNSSSLLNNYSGMYSISRSTATFPQPIPEHQPVTISDHLEKNLLLEEQKHQSNKDPHDRTATITKPRTHSKLSQTSSKLKHHMPCNPF